MKKSRLLGAVCASLLSSVSLSAYAAVVPSQGTWKTTLEARDLDGDPNTIEGWFDTILNITWLADANLATSNTFGVSGIDANGRMRWEAANSWIDAMNTNNYLGQSGWRLSTITDVGNNGATYSSIYQGVDYGYNIDTANGEMAHMFYNTLGNSAEFDINGVPTGCTSPDFCLSNTGTFSNMQSSDYWSSTVYTPNTNYMWTFNFNTGSQDTSFWLNNSNVWAVHDGDVGATVVPVPATVWLFGSGLLGLIGLAGKKRQK